MEIGYAFGKDENGNGFKAEMDAFLEEMRKDGTLSELMKNGAAKQSGIVNGITFAPDANITRGQMAAIMQ